jgi:hypothetical protein
MEKKDKRKEITAPITNKLKVIPTGIVIWVLSIQKASFLGILCKLLAIFTIQLELYLCQSLISRRERHTSRVSVWDLVLLC